MDVDEAHLPSRRLFEALDKRPLGPPEGLARIKVYSVFEQDERRWVQLRIEGYSERMLTLSIGRHEGAEEVLRLISLCLATPGSQFSSVA